MEFGPPAKRRNRKHTNSRFGCAQCKLRKVKCNEVRPKCGNCTRRQTECTYTNEPPSHQLDAIGELARVAASSVLTPQQASQFKATASSSTSTPKGSSPRLSTEGSYSTIGSPEAACAQCSIYENLAMPHLELLHHFMIRTVHASTTGPITGMIWQTEFPRIAFNNEFLMHALLAIAALHLAHDHPEKKETYWERAIAHEDRALELAHPQMAEPNASNADALFAFCMPTIYYAFAAPEHCQLQQDQQPLAGAVQVLNLLRGIFSIMPMVSQWVSQGPLAPLFVASANAPKPAEIFTNPETEAYFSRLLLFCTTVDPHHSETNGAAVSLLRHSFLCLEVADPSGEMITPPIWLWATRLPGLFVEKLQQRHVVPMVIVAHWCVLIVQVKTYWWAQTWVCMTLQEIRAATPPQHASWLDWPSQAIKRILSVRAKEGPPALPISVVINPYET